MVRFSLAQVSKTEVTIEIPASDMLQSNFYDTKGHKNLFEQVSTIFYVKASENRNICQGITQQVVNPT